jgi:hypothetical protein
MDNSWKSFGSRLFRQFNDSYCARRHLQRATAVGDGNVLPAVIVLMVMASFCNPLNGWNEAACTMGPLTALISRIGIIPPRLFTPAARRW